MQLDHARRLVCEQCGQVAYLDPRLAVAILLYGPGRVIYLAQRLVEPGWGKWIMPGGYVEVGEDLGAACSRELGEELRMPPGPVHLINVYQDTGRIFTAVFGAPLRIDPPNSSHAELGPLCRFSWADIPWSRLYFKSTRFALRDFLTARLRQDAKKRGHRIMAASL